MIQKLGLFSAIVLPFFNIPLILRIVRRKSSEDISLVWTLGIWVCTLGMLPSSLMSADLILRSFAIVNTVLFTAVVVAVLMYHPAVRQRRAPNEASSSHKGGIADE